MPYSACGRADPLYRGLCRPASVRPQGLATLSTDYSRPNLAGLVSCRLRSWAWPFRGCSSFAVELHSCKSEPTGWFKTRPLVHASTAIRRIPPPLGFAPQKCPLLDGRCYPATGLVPLLGLASLGFVLRPAGLVLRQTSARWLVRPAVTRKARTATRRINRRPTIIIRLSADRSRRTGLPCDRRGLKKPL